MGRIIPSVTMLLLVFGTSTAFEIEIAPAYKIAAQIGEKLVLTCSSSDCETPSFSWRTQMDNPLGGTVNHMGNNSILTMDPVGFANEHDYLCSACCGDAKREKNIRVDIYSFPSDPVIEISTPLNVGEEANVTCKVDRVYPSDRLELQLEKNGAVLARREFYEEMSSTKTTETKSLTWTFSPTFEDNGKDITCVAELPIDEMEFEPKKRQTSQRLSVNYTAFKMEIAPAYKIAAQIGDKLVLTCSSSGCETPSFSWRTQMDNPLGGTVNHMGNNSILTMDPVGFANEHDYLCSACCGDAKREKNIRVDIYSFPSDPVIEISTPLNVGEEASVTCKVDRVYPSDRLELQLEKNGAVLARREFYEEMSSTKTTETKSLTWTFSPTFEDNGKDITCVAELPIDEMEFEPKKRQTSQRLSVNSVPRITEFFIQPSTSVKEGENVTIICSVESNPPARIVLRRKSDNKDSVLYSNNGIVHVLHVTFLNAGNYECEAENTLGKSKVTAALSVEYGPRNTTVSVSPSAAVREGETVTMTCTSYGNPSPNISWTRHLYNGESQFLSENATLTINNIKAEDLGVYECESVNQFGREKNAVELIVQVPPKDTMLSVFPSDTVREGDSVTFSCTSEGIPAVQIILRKKTGSMDSVLMSENGSYTIYGAQLEDRGMYECESSNKLGHQLQNIMLDVKESVKKTYMLPMIGIVSSLSAIALSAFAVLVHMSRKARVNASYRLVNALKSNVKSNV